MSQSDGRDRTTYYPIVREHPEQRREEEPGREDPIAKKDGEIPSSAVAETARPGDRKSQRAA